MLILRKQLMMDVDPQELARVKLLLDKNGIQYEVKTTLSDNVLSRNFNAKAAETVRSTYSAMATQHYLYRLFVRPGDYKKARMLVYGK